MPRLFETPEPVVSLASHHDPGAPEEWPGALTALAAEGLLDRAALLDACTARLLRGGTALHLKPYRSVLEALRPTPEEERERTADWIALTADAPSPSPGTRRRCWPASPPPAASARHAWPRCPPPCSSAPRRSSYGRSWCCSARCSPGIRPPHPICCRCSARPSGTRTPTSRSGP
ncbi:hypothetical protein ACFQ60_45590 [Streptomyces zhihengii]